MRSRFIALCTLLCLAAGLLPSFGSPCARAATGAESGKKRPSCCKEKMPVTAVSALPRCCCDPSGPTRACRCVHQAPKSQATGALTKTFGLSPLLEGLVVLAIAVVLPKPIAPTVHSRVGNGAPPGPGQNPRSVRILC